MQTEQTFHHFIITTMRIYSFGMTMQLDVIDVEIVVNTNHLGFFEIKLCVVDDDSEETNECFDGHPLAVMSGPGGGPGWQR